MRSDPTPRSIGMMRPGFLVTLLATAVFVIDTASAQVPTADYAGKQVQIIVGYDAGTDYDSWARLMARHIGHHLPGNPTVIVENMPGAGSIKATSYLYAEAPKDGTVFGAIGRDVITLPLIEPEAVARFEPTKFGWLGSPTTETNVCAANKSAGLRTADDLFSKQLIVGGTGAGTGTSIYPRALNGLLHTKFKVADGYKSSNAVLLAMERHEVDGICQSYSYLKEKEAARIAAGDVVILLQGGLKPNPHLEGVTFARDLAKTADQRQGLDFLYGSQAYARPFVAPPGLPPAILASLRTAFDATLKDPQMAKDAATMQLDLDPVDGKEVQALIEKSYETPKATIELFRSIIRPQ